MSITSRFSFDRIDFSCGLVLILAFSLTATSQSTAAQQLFASPQPLTLSQRAECLSLTATMCSELQLAAPKSSFEEGSGSRAHPPQKALIPLQSRSVIHIRLADEVSS